MIEAQTLEQLFDFAKIFDQVLPCGGRVGIITNGGGMGVLATDSLEEEGLSLAPLSEETRKAMLGSLPSYTNVRNPLDISGDADSHRYEVALNAMMKDDNVDIILLIILFQTAGIDSSVVNIAIRASDRRKKPIIAVCTGGEYTEMHKRILESYGVPSYASPSSAMRAISRFLAMPATTRNTTAWTARSRSRSRTLAGSCSCFSPAKPWRPGAKRGSLLFLSAPFLLPSS